MSSLERNAPLKVGGVPSAVGTGVALVALMLALGTATEAQTPNLEWLSRQCAGTEGSAVGGSVLEAGDLTPAAGAIVVMGRIGHGADDDPQVTTTDATGRFALCSIDDFPVVGIRASRGRESSPSLGVGISDALTWGGDLVLDPTPRATVIGRVFDSASREPLAGATVAAPGIGTMTTTDDLGCFRLAGLPTRQVLLETVHPRFGARTDTLLINPPDTTDAAIGLGAQRQPPTLGPLVLATQRVASDLPEGLIEWIEHPSGATLSTDVLNRTGREAVRIEGGAAAGFLCVEETLHLENSGCQMAEVLWDGQWAPTPGRLLAHAEPKRIGRVGFWPSDDARSAFCFRGEDGVLFVESASGHGRREGTPP